MDAARQDHPLALEYMALPPEVRGGSLSFFGYSVGRPLDCFYPAESAYAADGYLRIHFDGTMIVELWNPSPLRVEGICLYIDRADRLLYSSESAVGRVVQRDHVVADQVLTATFGDGTPITHATRAQPALEVV